MIPKSIQKTLENEFDVEIKSESTVSGGSINRAHKLETNKNTLFLKWNQSAPDDFFEVEAKGLELLSSADSGLRIPTVMAWQRPNTNTPGFLVLEYIEEGSGSPSDSFQFGVDLAKLHSNHSEQFGLSYDNYIGSLHQKNGEYSDWIDFFVEKRIQPQLKMAIDSGKLSQALLKNWKRIINQLDGIIPPCTPSLIHGDLWGGNYLFNSEGKAVLIDPAVYYGHPEMDLAFSKMFGGFSSPFYEGYQSVSPFENGFFDRVPVYNMYPLLVHVNLFAGHYTSQFSRFLQSF